MLEGWWDIAGVGRDGGVVVVKRLGGDPDDCCCLLSTTRQFPHCRPHLLGVRPAVDLAQTRAAASRDVFSNALSPHSSFLDSSSMH